MALFTLVEFIKKLKRGLDQEIVDTLVRGAGMSRERSTYCSGYRCKRELTESSDRVQICVCSNTGKTMMADFKNTE